MVKVGQYWKHINTLYSYNWLTSHKLKHIDLSNHYGYFDFISDIPYIEMISLCTKDGKKFPLFFQIKL